MRTVSKPVAPPATTNGDACAGYTLAPRNGGRSELPAGVPTDGEVGGLSVLTALSCLIRAAVVAPAVPPALGGLHPGAWCREAPVHS